MPGCEPLLAVVTAVWGEAKSIVEHYRLAPGTAADGLTLHRGDRMLLGVCGKGPVNARRFAARFAGWLRQTGQPGPTLWVNFGTAGSAAHAPGTLVQGVRVTAASGACELVLDAGELPGVPQVTVHTCAAPVSDYCRERVYDMEAAGFIAGLASICAAPPARIIKLVADGPGRPWQRQSRAQYQQTLDAAGADTVRLLDTLRRAHERG